MMQQMFLFGLLLLTCTKLLCHDCLIPIIVIQAHGFFKLKVPHGLNISDVMYILVSPTASTIWLHFNYCVATCTLYIELLHRL